MDGKLHDFSQAQLRASLGPCTDIAFNGAKLAFNVAHSRVSDCFTMRLVYHYTRRMACDAEDHMDDHVAYSRLFDARPEGSKMRFDEGFGMRFQANYENAINSIDEASPFIRHRPLTGTLREQRDSVPLPIRAMERARAHRMKAYSQFEANIEAQRLLASEGMFPLRPLPVFIEIPRIRRDPDWIIGALRRFADGLIEASEAFEAAEAFLDRAETILPAPLG